MRQLIILRGAMGAGKSTWLKNNKLEEYVLSADSIRMQAGSPVLKEAGGKAINPTNESFTWKVLYDLLERRMSNGDFTIVDATHVKASSFQKYRQLCKKYMYRCYVVEFEEELSVLLERNKKRIPIDRVPEHVIANAHAKMSVESSPKWVTRTKPDTFFKDVMWRRTDKSGYKNVFVIGDIHGSMDALREAVIHMNDGEEGLLEDSLYVFTGDYLDRGLQNAEVLQYLLTIYESHNVVLLTGNHEAHLINWANDDDIRSRKFVHSTQPALEDAGIPKASVRKLCQKLQQVLWMNYHGREYVITHGGLSYFDFSKMSLVSTSQMINGVGDYETNIDSIWNDVAKTKSINPVYQIHGHRNTFKVGATDYKYSINLEGDVEYNGYLRYLNINKDGHEAYNVKNCTGATRSVTDTRKSLKDMTVADYLEDAENSNLIKAIELPNNIKSLNFTRKAFHDKKWNDLTVHARGMFVNTEHKEIVARGYNKFFNFNERAETKMQSLSQSLKFPVDIYHKYNGYLGIMSYDKYADKLSFYTKSLSSDVGTKMNHSKMFEKEFYTMFSEESATAIGDYSKEHNVSLLFEVVLPEFDPHIIEYQQNHLVLLDVVKNELQMQKLPYDKLVEFASEYGIEVKEKAITVNNFKEYKEFHDEYTNNVEFKSEGFAVEDSNGFVFKLKLPYYTMWKYLRGLMASVRKQQDKPIKYLNSPTEQYFIYYIRNILEDKELLQQHNLILVRNMFEDWQK